MRLWEHRDRIVSGEWPELAPLLVLCEASPTEQTLQQEVELIHNSGLPREVQTELITVAVSVASRRFSLSVLRTIFAEELLMLDETENLTELLVELGLAQKWVRDPRISGKMRAEVEAKAKAEGRSEGRTEGEVKAKREMTLAVLTRRFGDLPDALVERITTADADWCQHLFDRAITAASLSELIESM